jgi:pimeloyl-ACP methyl ester carboxylesterase
MEAFIDDQQRHLESCHSFKKMEMTAKAALLTALSTAKVQERTFICSDGLRLASQWYPPSALTKRRILLLHGWMDNCRSFWKLAPSLHTPDTELVAMDFPGHGKSQHKSKDGPPLLLAEGAYYVGEVLHQLGWTNDTTLIGHSMGAAIALTYAAAFPDQIHKLVLLEGAGPLSRDAQDVAHHVRRHVQRRLEGIIKPPRTYPSIEKAAETRQTTATLSPGNQYLSKEAALELVMWAMKETPDGGFAFQHDPRLQWPSLLYMTHDQVEALQCAVQCPTALLLAQDGWPFDETQREGVLQRLRPILYDTLPGSHHFHADPDQADEVARRVEQFLTE